MIKELKLKNFSLFADHSIKLSKGLNVIIGENGTGKSHLLKLAYVTTAMSAEANLKNGHSVPTKSEIQTSFARKMNGVFRPDSLGNLTSKGAGRVKCDIEALFFNDDNSFAVSFSKNSKKSVEVVRLPGAFLKCKPVFIMPHELMTIYPGFVSMYDSRHMQFEETWRDLCVLLSLPPLKSLNESYNNILNKLESVLGGTIQLDSVGRFYLKTAKYGKMEMFLVCEGLRKIAAIYSLIRNGSILSGNTLFWDEPESNLNPRIIKQVAEIIIELVKNEVQVVVCTHSLFFMRELEIQITKEGQPIEAIITGLSLSNDSLIVEQGCSFDDIDSIAALDEALMQSDRYMGE